MLRKRIVLGLFLVLLVSVLTFTLHIQPVRADPIAIYINGDGSVTPSASPIATSDNITYTFSGNISYPAYYGVIVQRNDVVIDGNGFTVQGNETGIGLYLESLDNVTIKNINVENCFKGILLNSSSNCDVVGSNITGNARSGIELSNFSNHNNMSENSVTTNSYNGIRLEMNSSFNSLNGNNITNNYFGVALDSSFDNNISDNQMTNSYNDIYLSSSSGNNLSDNNITNNVGAELESSSNNSISGNTFTDSGLRSFFSFQNSVENNTANDKPLVYLEAKANYSISDAGQVILVSCDNITVQNLSLSNNAVGVELWATNNSVISESNITGEVGVEVDFCNHDSIIGNNITNGFDGIGFDTCSDNSIDGNNIENSTSYSIHFYSCSGNNISGNNITNSGDIGLEQSANNSIIGNDVPDLAFWLSSGNMIYHNNIYLHSSVANIYQSTNVWDDGYPSGGNYWSGYNGTDFFQGLYQNVTGSDGIGDTPYMIDANNLDNYPLIGAYSEFFPAFFSGNNISVVVISNSTVSDLIYAIWLSTPYDGLQPGVPFIEFLTSGQNGSTSFCRVMIPRSILNATTYNISVNYNPVNFTELSFSDSNYVYLYFTYPMPAQQVIVSIPEFTSYLLPLLFVMATLIGALILRRKVRIR